MPLVDVTLTNDAYSREFDASYRLSDDDVLALASSVSALTISGSKPALVGASAHCDDTVHRDGKDEDGVVRLFVNVVLRIEAADEDEAQDLDVDDVDGLEALLNEVASRMLSGGDLEGGWEVLQTEATTPSTAP